jgi:hypothetical protein
MVVESVRQEPDLTLEEIQRRLLDERQQKTGIGSVWRFFDRHGKPPGLTIAPPFPISSIGCVNEDRTVCYHFATQLGSTGRDRAGQSGTTGRN